MRLVKRVFYVYWLTIALVFLSTLLVMAVLVPVSGKERTFNPVKIVRQYPVVSLRFAIAALTSIPLSLLAAGLMTKPISRLQRTTHQLAEGNLRARVPVPEETRTENEFVLLALDINRMAARIEELLSNQKRFLAQVSHELGSPLTRIHLSIALSRRKNLREAAPEIDMIEEEVRHLSSLIQQLLLLARMENYEETSEPRTVVDLGEFLAEAVGRCRLMAAEKSIYLDLHRTERLHASAYVSLLRSAFDNVLQNAIHHSPSHGRVEIAMELDGDTAAIYIRDHGTGVPEEELCKLFRPFYRVSSTPTRPGNGLGLAIVQQAILTHHGSVSASNAVIGSGLVIQIRIPASPYN